MNQSYQTPNFERNRTFGIQKSLTAIKAPIKKRIPADAKEYSKFEELSHIEKISVFEKQIESLNRSLISTERDNEVKSQQIIDNEQTIVRQKETIESLKVTIKQLYEEIDNLTILNSQLTESISTYKEKCSTLEKEKKVSILSNCHINYDKHNNSILSTSSSAKIPEIQSSTSSSDILTKTPQNISSKRSTSSLLSLSAENQRKRVFNSLYSPIKEEEEEDNSVHCSPETHQHLLDIDEAILRQQHKDKTLQLSKYKSMTKQFINHDSENPLDTMSISRSLFPVSPESPSVTHSIELCHTPSPPSTPTVVPSMRHIQRTSVFKRSAGSIDLSSPKDDSTLHIQRLNLQSSPSEGESLIRRLSDSFNTTPVSHKPTDFSLQTQCQRKLNLDDSDVSTQRKSILLEFNTQSDDSLQISDVSAPATPISISDSDNDELSNNHETNVNIETTINSIPNQMIDVDNMTYEQLQEFEKSQGNVQLDKWKEIQQDFIHKLELYTYKSIKNTMTNETKDLCLICQYDYEDEDSVNILPCHHLFHQECLNGWLKGHFKCPFCPCNLLDSYKKT